MIFKNMSPMMRRKKLKLMATPLADNMDGSVKKVSFLDSGFLTSKKKDSKKVKLLKK